MAATIKDIVKETGLAPSTISAYLNGNTVRPKNKVLIENAIKKLGYVRNEYARGLKLHKSGTIGVLIPELSNTFGTTIIGAIGEALREQGYSLIVCDTLGGKSSEEKSVQLLLSKMVDGLVVLMPTVQDGSFLDIAVNANVPVVVIDRLIDRSDVVQIIINNRDVSNVAVQKMIDSGHRNVGIITGNQDIYTAYERHGGYMDALMAAGCYREDYVYNGGLTVEGAYIAMKSLAEEHPEITALFVTNYEMTIGSIIAINELGKQIGKDYAFVGFDNLGLSAVVSPRLATINQPMEEMGKIAAEMLLRAIKQQKTLASIITLPAELETGESIMPI